MKKSSFLLLVALIVFAGCAKNTDYNKDYTPGDGYIFNGKFKYKDQLYTTLQEAVNVAVKSYDKFAETSPIYLTGNVWDEGSEIDPALNGYFELNLDKFDFYVREGHSIGTGNTVAYISGDGGSIIGYGTVITSTGGTLDICGDVNIIGNIESESEIVFQPSYSGTFKGDFILDDEPVSIYSTHVGEMKIYNVSADGKMPVRTVSAENILIESGAELHVHKSAIAEPVPATCIMPALVRKVCDECGYEWYEVTDESPAGHCDASKLIHITAKEATATEGGNIEYWECPLCGRRYLDSDANVPVTAAVSTMPTNYFTFDEICAQENIADEIEVAGFSGKILSVLSNSSIGLAGILPDGTLWNDVNTMLDSLQQQLDDISLKFSTVTQRVSTESAKKSLVARHQQLASVSAPTQDAIVKIDRIINDQLLSEQEKKDRLTSAVKEWKNSDGVRTISNLQSFAEQFYDAAEAGGRSVAESYAVLANTAYPWEHMGYPFQKEMALYDEYETCSAMLLEYFHTSFAKEFANPQERTEELEKIADEIIPQFSQCLISTDASNELRAQSYRCYNPVPTTFNIALSIRNRLDILQWFTNHRNVYFPRDNEQQAVESCEGLLAQLGWDAQLSMTRGTADQIRGFYQNDTLNTYGLILKEIGFEQLPKTDYKVQYVFKETESFSVRDNTASLPKYKNFQWTSRKTSSDSDYFVIQNVINDSFETDYATVIDCGKFNTADGRISSLGQVSDDLYNMLVWPTVATE